MKARTRLLKPQAFIDADLWELGVETGLPIFQGFMGLLCWADREGRFEWKPKELRVGILPYWDGDFGAVLNALARGRFVVRYEQDGHTYGHVRTFTKHQSVNHREERSRLPPPPGHVDAEDDGPRRRGIVDKWGVEVEEARREAMPIVAPEPTESEKEAIERLAREALKVYKGGR